MEAAERRMSPTDPLPCHLELAFEYLFGKDNLKWVTIKSDQVSDQWWLKWPVLTLLSGQVSNQNVQSDTQEWPDWNADLTKFKMTIQNKTPDGSWTMKLGLVEGTMIICRGYNDYSVIYV